MQPATPNFLALDVGSVRVGVAVASAEARLPRPLTTLPNDDGLIDGIKHIMEYEQAGVLVVGLPRGLDGQETDQTRLVRDFCAKLEQQLSIKVNLQDEALTSVKAKEELESLGKRYQKEDIDALAAAYILEDFLKSYNTNT